MLQFVPELQLSTLFLVSPTVLQLKLLPGLHPRLCEVPSNIVLNLSVHIEAEALNPADVGVRPPCAAWPSTADLWLLLPAALTAA